MKDSFVILAGKICDLYYVKVNYYLCTMKNEISIPVLKEEDSVAAKIRRDNYSMGRDIQATKFNEAIAARLLAEQKIHIKCEKCGKEFESEITGEDSKVCPECSLSI